MCLITSLSHTDILTHCQYLTIVTLLIICPLCPLYALCTHCVHSIRSIHRLNVSCCQHLTATLNVGLYSLCHILPFYCLYTHYVRAIHRTPVWLRQAVNSQMHQIHGGWASETARNAELGRELSATRSRLLAAAQVPQSRLFLVYDSKCNYF